MVLACVGRILMLAVFVRSSLLGSAELRTKNDTFIKQLLSKKVGYSLLYEYRSTLFKQDLSSLARNSSFCFADFEAIAKDGKALISYLDAVGKPDSGLFRGNYFWMGSVGECEDIPHAHYCLSSLGFSIPSYKLDMKTGITWCACFPKSCGDKELYELLNYLIPKVENVTGVKIYYHGTHCPEKPTYTYGVKVTLIICAILLLLCLIGTFIDWAKEAFNDPAVQTNEPSSLNTCENGHMTGDGVGLSNNISNQKDGSETTSAKTYENIHVVENGVVLSSDDVPLLNPNRWYTQCYVWSKVKDPLCGFFLCFSLVRNTKKIFNTNVPPRAITSINGIRVISISWVILGHTFGEFAGSPLSENRVEFTKDSQLFTIMPVINGYYSVDSFFFLSGLLVSYTCFRKLRNSNGKFNWILFYVHRFWRLTPSYMFLILISVQLKRFLSDGPLWYQQYEDPVCKKYWWTNLLYINNFYPSNASNDGCVGWTWYLANDMQFFVITPLLIFPLFKFGRRALVVPIGLLLASSLTIAVIIAYYDLDVIIFLKFAKLLNTFSQKKSMEYMKYIYIKPYCRIQPYLVGFLLGYFMYKNYTSSKQPGWIVTLVGWAVAIVVGMLLVYGIHDSILPGAKEWNTAENILYGISHRLLWGVVLAWVTYACHYGAGGLVQKFLSAGFWIPLSRLTYSVYLIHLIVVPVVLVGAKNLIHYDFINVSYYFIAVVVLSYGAGFILAVTIEFPCDNLEQMAIKALKGFSPDIKRRVTTLGTGLIYRLRVLCRC